ncbi:MAG TPA: NAD(P)H-dependent oxidoreductase [Verrucomicrobiae bacterium]|nr:NAD(P)H-dependent oxidoreductase [Verrucomicrobiae bacterium]
MAIGKNSLRVLAVTGSLNRDSLTRVVVAEAARQLAELGCGVDILDFEKDPLPLYNPNTAYDAPSFPALKRRVDRADVLLLGTPDYHGGISSAMKSFLDHFWQEFGGKLFATIVSSHEKGLTVTDQLRTVARQCYAWSLPYGVAFTGNEDIKDGRIASPTLNRRLEMMCRDIAIYGKLLARQRRSDLASNEPGFMERLREVNRVD